MADGETTGVPDEHTGASTSDDKESTGVPDIEAYDMAVIDATIEELAATLDQELREANAKPEETELPEADMDVELSHPITNNKSTRRFYNLCKYKKGSLGRKYSHRFGDHSMALLNPVLTHLSMKLGLCK